METGFSNTIIVNNINFLLKKKGNKIGELEANCGVSAGYLSKLSKDPSMKPSIEFLINVSDYYKVSIDFLVSTDISAISPSEAYLYGFLNKLLSDTFQNKLYWQIETANDLNSLTADKNGNVDHPLFGLETFYMKGETDYPEEITRTTFNSNAYGFNTVIDGHCFNLKMKNSTYIYLMKICKDVYHTGNKLAHRIEAWLWSPLAGKQYLCDNLDDSELSNVLNTLYIVVDDYHKHPHIKEELKKSVEAFMNDDLSDDKDFVIPDELPFY